MDFQDTWITRKLYPLGYPFKISPKLSFIKKIDITAVLDVQTLFIIRKSDLPFNQTFKKTLGEELQLNENAIDYQRVINMSSCILGGLFKSKHLNYSLSINSFASEKWDGITKLPFYKLLKYISKPKNNKEVCDIYIDAKKLHKITHPIKASGQNSEVEKFIKGSGFQFPCTVENGTKSYTLSGSCEVIHDPLNLNYWHCELGVFDFNESPVAKYNKGWHKHFCTTLIANVISINSYPNLSNIENLSSDFYEKAG